MNARERFEKGMELLESGLGKEAMEQLAMAHALEPLNPTYQSYYGLALATVAGSYPAGLELISAAINEDGQNPIHHVNLARAHLSHRHHDSGVSQLYEALRVDPGNPQVIRRLEDLRVRAEPALPFLSRTHWLNRCLGRLRHTLFGFSDLQEMDGQLSSGAGRAPVASVRGALRRQGR